MYAFQLKISKKTLKEVDISAQLDAQMSRIKQANNNTYSLINQAYLDSLPVIDADNRNIVFRAECVTAFSGLLGNEIYEIAEQEARRAWQFAS